MRLESKGNGETYSEKLLLASSLVKPCSAPGNVIQVVGGRVDICLVDGVTVLALICRCKPAEPENMVMMKN